MTTRFATRLLALTAGLALAAGATNTSTNTGTTPYGVWQARLGAVRG